MRCHNCQHVPARDAPPLDPDRLAFCPGCGYPLARVALPVVTPGSVLALPEGGSATIEVTVFNQGDGLLYYALLLTNDVPFQAPDGGSAGHVAPRTSRVIALSVRTDDVPAGLAQLGVQLLTLTRQPAQPRQWRTEPVEGLWEEQPLHLLQLQRLTKRPLLLTAEHLLFGKEAEKPSLRAVNYGSIEMCGSLDCTRGFEVAVKDGPFGPHAELMVPPATDNIPGITRIYARCTEASADHGWLSYRPASGSGDEERQVHLENVHPGSAGQTTYRYTVGIDFGTAKTAVAWLDNWRLGAVVQLIEWPELDAQQDDRRYLPSAVLLPSGEGSAKIGRQALRESHRTGVEVRLYDDGRQQVAGLGWLFVGMKMHLLDRRESTEGPSAQEAATRFLRYVLSHLRDTALVGGRPLDTAQTMFVLTLPVLGSRAEYDQQAELTSRAFCDAAAEIKLELKADQVRCAAEPVCAAMDYAAALRDQGTAVGGGIDRGDGEYLLVFDCGAGTTDLSAVRVNLDESGMRFEPVAALGFRWGGDKLDSELLRMLLYEWTTAGDPAAQSPKYLEAVDEEEVGDPPPQDGQAWVRYFQEAEALRFKGSTQVITRSQLLGMALRFKERWFNETVKSGEDEALRLSTPALSEWAGEGDLGDLSHATETLDLAQLVQDVGHLFGDLRDELTGRLREVMEPRLLDKLGGGRLGHVFLVGGGTLIRGCREYILSETRFGRLAEFDQQWRRFHVARGAAQCQQIEISTRLPEPAAVELGAWHPSRGFLAATGPHARRELPAGTPPDSHHGTLPATAMVRDDPEEQTLARLLLGARVLQQVPVGKEDVERHLAQVANWKRGRAWGGQPPLDVVLTYRPGEGLLLQLTLNGDPTGPPMLVPAEAVKLPVFEE